LILGEHYDRAHGIQKLIDSLARMTTGRRMPVMVCDRLERPCPQDESSREIHHFLTEPELGKIPFGDDFFVVIRGRFPDSIQGKSLMRKTIKLIPVLTEGIYRSR
jgi:hypothetical protein